MTFTSFSFIMSLFWISLFGILTVFLRKHMQFIECFSIYPLIIIFFLSFLRLFCPFELPYTIVVLSETFLPKLQTFLNYPLIHIGNFNISLDIILISIWIIIAIIKISIKLYEYKCFQRLIQLLPTYEDKTLEHVVLRVQDMMPSKKHVMFIVNKNIRIPSIIGFITPTILLPDLIFTDDELLGIITHEWAHYYYKHALIKAFGEIIQCIFWWNPIFKKLNFEITHILELHSDKAVDKILNKEQKLLYLNAIIKVAENLNICEMPIFICGLVKNNEEKMINQRFEMIMNNNYSRTPKFRIILLFLPIFIAFILSYSFILQPHSEPTIEDYGEMDQIPNDSYLVEIDNGYELYDSNDQLIGNIKYIDEQLNNLKLIKKELD